MRLHLYLPQLSVRVISRSSAKMVRTANLFCGAADARQQRIGDLEGHSMSRKVISEAHTNRE